MNGTDVSADSRRAFLRAGLSLAGVSIWGVHRTMAQSDQPGGSPRKPGDEDVNTPRPQGSQRQEHEQEEEISPAEDLMREHGLLTRVLLVYQNYADRLALGARDIPAEPLHRSADIVREFVEDYHERLEEQYLFPRFRKAGMLVELVDTLQTQHDAGRRITDIVRKLAVQSAFKDQNQRLTLIDALRQFNRMYLPHESREDTVLFPAFRKLVSPNEYDALGEQFENREHELFGEDGFEMMVDRVADVEGQVGIHDLAQFTPTM